MIPLGLVLLVGAAAMAVTGTLGYLASRRSASRSRSAALTLFGHGALATSGSLFLATLVHLHSLVTVHLHSIPEAFEAAFVCDFEWSCVAWIAATIAVTVLIISFVLSQIVARAIVARAMRAGARAVPARGHGDARVLIVPDPRPDAYSVALLRLGGRTGFRARDYVLLTTGLLKILTPAERKAVLEHELAHVRARDDRYLPFFHVVTSVLFFDPVLRRLRERLGRSYELEADDMAARRTRDPRSLAHALLKFYEAASQSGVPAGIGLLGNGHTSFLIERIERLLALAEQMDAGTA
ncbi:MAG: M56 family metallopeptidase [Candidatus Thermoplasmatota archaeon]